MHCRPRYKKSMRSIMPSHQEESPACCHTGPIHALFVCIVCIITLLYHYYLLLYLLFHKSETAIGCVFIAENLPIGTSTTGDQWAYNPRASACYQGLNHQAPTSSLPCCQLPLPAHRDRSRGCTPANPHAFQVWTYLSAVPARCDWGSRILHEPAK